MKSINPLIRRADVKFQVFNKGKLVEKFDLRGAYLFGTDGMAIRRADIGFKKGVIECKKPNLETAGLALLWPIEGFGRVLLPTTCLPERNNAYNLNVEIARGKLMQIINKREDWSFFNEIDGSGGGSKQAQEHFIKAVQNIADAPAAAQLADEALKKGAMFAEELAIKQAQSLFETRIRSRGFGRGCMGCGVDLEQINKAGYADCLAKLFGSVTIPINWAKIEARKGSYNFAAIDACIEVLSKRKLALCAGPVLCFSKEYLPEWLLRGNLGFEKIRELAYHFVSTMVKRYTPWVQAWRVISGLNVFNYFEFTFEQVLEMTRAANMAAKAAMDKGLKIIEISNPWGEYYSSGINSIPPIVYMDMVIQSGINFDAFGLKLQFGRDQDGMHVRDMMEISAMLDSIGPVAKPLFVTAVEVPSGGDGGGQSGEVAGVWHKKWDQQQQGRWLDEFYKIALSKAFVDNVTYSHLADTDKSMIANSGLLTAKYQAKESFKVLQKLRERLFGR